MTKRRTLISAAPAVLAFIPSQVSARTSEAVSYSYEGAVQEASNTFFVQEVIKSSDEATTPVIKVRSFRWNKEMESRFDELALKHAFGESNIEEEIKLEELQSIRLQELAPRSYEEVRREFEIEKATKNALEAIDTLARTVATFWPSKASEKKA
jgi:predicted DNA-binding protein (UPF0251 family)